MQNRLVTRGVLIREEHIETLKRLPNKTMDAVLGAAFRVCLGQSAMLAVKDCNGILNAIVQSIAVSAKKFDENESAKRRNDAERKRRAREAEKNAQKDPLSVGHPSLSDGQTRTDADENGQKRTKADGRGVRTERKKEGKNIYTPISPKGICEDYSEDVDFDAMMGTMGVDCEGETDRGVDVEPEDDAEGGTDLAEDIKVNGLIAESAKVMTASHPNKSGTDSFERSLRRYLKKNPGADLELIRQSHERWVASGIWEDEGGRYAPNLKNWLWGGDWKHMPPEKKAARQEQRPIEDASVFHAGASL